MFQDDLSMWNDLTDLDAMWACCPRPGKKNGGWRIPDFFESGRSFGEQVMNLVHHYQSATDAALEIGCGLGRVTRALAPYFKQCVGLDVSNKMVEQAKILNHGHKSLEFGVVDEKSLQNILPQSYDVVLAHALLPSMSSQQDMQKVLVQMVKAMRPGGLMVFDAPHISLGDDPKHPDKTLFYTLANMGVPKGLLWRFGVSPIQYHWLSEDLVRQIIKSAGGMVVSVTEEMTEGQYRSQRYVATKRTLSGA